MLLFIMFAFFIVHVSMLVCTVQWTKIQLEYLASINSKDIQHGTHV